MNTPTADPFFKLGASIGATLLTENPEELPAAMAKEAALQRPEAGPYHQELCKMAVAAFDTAGEPHAAEAILFRNLAGADKWHPSYNRFTDCVRRAMAKNAAMLLPGIFATHDKLGGNMVKTLTAGGALGGAALGSLAFLLSRNARQSSAENEALLEKVRAYKQLKRDIQEDMSAREVMSGPSSGKRGYDV